MLYYVKFTDADGNSGQAYLTVDEIRTLYQTTQIYDEDGNLVNDPANSVYLDPDAIEAAGQSSSSSSGSSGGITPQSSYYTGSVTISGTTLTFDNGLLSTVT